jgi:hypothetical protein
MITITAILNAIEAHAERAIVPELRLIKKEVEKLRPCLCSWEYCLHLYIILYRCVLRKHMHNYSIRNEM